MIRFLTTNYNIIILESYKYYYNIEVYLDIIVIILIQNVL